MAVVPFAARPGTARVEVEGLGRRMVSTRESKTGQWRAGGRGSGAARRRRRQGEQTDAHAEERCSRERCSDRGRGRRAGARDALVGGRRAAVGGPFWERRALTLRVVRRGSPISRGQGARDGDDRRKRRAPASRKLGIQSPLAAWAWAWAR